jgi:hypothetical protein
MPHYVETVVAFMQKIPEARICPYCRTGDLRAGRKSLCADEYLEKKISRCGKGTASLSFRLRSSGQISGIFRSKAYEN